MFDFGFFNICVLKGKFFEIVYNIWVKFNFLLNCHSYTLEKMSNLDDTTNENNKYHNLKWSYITDHLYKMLITGGSGSGKTNALLNLIEEQDSDSLIDKIYLYVEELNEPKYQFLIKKRKDVGIKHLNDLEGFIELFTRCWKLNISLVFITQYYFSVPKEVTFNSTHYLIMKIHNKRELQNLATNHSADIDYNDFINIYRKCTSEPYSFFTIDTTLPANNPLRF